MITSNAPRSPFASSSWEPRFAVEHCNPEALHAAIELWRLGEYRGRCARDAAVTHMALHPEYLLVKHPNDTWLGGAWEELPEAVALADLPEWITRWLRTARYPEQPNFDGDEGPGFCVFWAHFACAESDSYGSLVVMPKWIEIHK